MVNVHLVEPSNDKEEHHWVFDVNQEDEKELVAKRCLTVSNLALQDLIKWLARTLRTKLVCKFNEAEETCEHETNLENWDLEKEKPISVVVNICVICLIRFIKPWQKSKDIDYIVPEEDACYKWQIENVHPLLEYKWISEKSAVHDPKK